MATRATCRWTRRCRPRSRTVPGSGTTQADAAFAVDAGDLEPTALFHRASAALDAGDTSAAGAGLMLALRSSPELAPAIIDVLAGRNDPMLLLVRADAYQLVGREVEATRDRAAAAGGIRPAADQAHVSDEASTAQDDDAATTDEAATADEPATADGPTIFDEAAIADAPPPADDPQPGA